MKNLFKKIVTLVVIVLVLLGIVSKPQSHIKATEIDPGPANGVSR